VSIEALDADRLGAEGRRFGLEKWGPGGVGSRPTPKVDVVVPVHNDELDLERWVRRLRAYLALEFPYSAEITIADSASTDGTLAVASRLAAEFHDVRLLHVNDLGRGRALAAAWLTTEASVVAQMEVAAAAGPSALLHLVAPIISGESDVSIGTPGRVDRRARETVRGLYGVVLRLTSGLPFDLTGWRVGAMRTDAARSVLPAVGNRDWFFDTELLLRAKQAGLRIHRLSTPHLAG
jgi:glycosyltransferase involved in cell wall biosynthesis